MDSQKTFREFPDDLFGQESKINESDKLLFSEDEPGKERKPLKTPWKILTVDDEEDIHSVTEIALRDFSFRGRNIKFFSAYSAKEARKILIENPDMALVLLDVVMETDHAGLDLVKYIRGYMNNPFIRIILRTGQPGHAPEREVIVSYEIDDYKTKTELTSAKLFTVALASLRAYETLKGVEQINHRLQMQLKDRISMEKELIMAKEKSEENERLKAELLEHLSDQIKESLDVILDSTLEIRNEINNQISEELKQLFDKMTFTGKRIIRSVQMNLDLSDVQSGDYTPKPRMVDIKKVCEGLIKNHDFSLKEKKIKVVLSPETERTLVKTDEYSVTQVLDNLLDNAIKFTSKGGVEIKLLQEDERLMLEMEDTGSGIGRDFKAKMFEPFSQENKDHTEGNGLGLALVKEYCNLNKLKLQVATKKGHGTRFSLFL